MNSTHMTAGGSGDNGGGCLPFIVIGVIIVVMCYQCGT